MVYKDMTSRNRPKYLEALPELVHRYNTRVHSSIKMAPADVIFACTNPPHLSILTNLNAEITCECPNDSNAVRSVLRVIVEPLVRRVYVVVHRQCSMGSIITHCKRDKGRPCRVVFTNLNYKKCNRFPTVGDLSKTLNTRGAVLDDKCW